MDSTLMTPLVQGREKDDGDAGADAAAEEAAERKYETIDPVYDAAVFALLDDLIAKHHASDLAEAKIALLWHYDVAPDKDGHLELGKTRKVPDRERAFHDHDFAIELNHLVWSTFLTPPQQRALLDHHLEHCGRVEKEDGSSTYYIRKHDLEEFNAVVRRHGLWREGVEVFVNAALEKSGGPTLFDRPDGGNGAEPKSRKEAIG